MVDILTITDRYGGNYPDPDSVCEGQCEGLGCYPSQRPPTKGEKYRFDKGWYWITCHECDGTGKRKQ